MTPASSTKGSARGTDDNKDGRQPKVVGEIIRPRPNFRPSDISNHPNIWRQK